MRKYSASNKRAHYCTPMWLIAYLAVSSSRLSTLFNFVCNANDEDCNCKCTLRTKSLIASVIRFFLVCLKDQTFWVALVDSIIHGLYSNAYAIQYEVAENSKKRTASQWGAKMSMTKLTYNRKCVLGGVSECVLLLCFFPSFFLVQSQCNLKQQWRHCKLQSVTIAIAHEGRSHRSWCFMLESTFSLYFVTGCARPCVRATRLMIYCHGFVAKTAFCNIHINSVWNFLCRNVCFTWLSCEEMGKKNSFFFFFFFWKMIEKATRLNGAV